VGESSTGPNSSYELLYLHYLHLIQVILVVSGHGACEQAACPTPILVTHGGEQA
jgi:hypothetical protein